MSIFVYSISHGGPVLMYVRKFDNVDPGTPISPCRRVSIH